MKLVIGSDHGGFDLKENIKAYLDEQGIAYTDYGTHTPERCDYPVVAKKWLKPLQMEPLIEVSSSAALASVSVLQRTKFTASGRPFAMICFRLNIAVATTMLIS